MVRNVVEEREVGLYTWADFLKLPDDDRRELIDGRLVEVEVPNGAHEFIVAVIITALGVWRRAHGGGRVVASGFKIRISDHRGVMPDVQFHRAGGGARPELSVEVISPSSRKYDRVIKLEYYASVGTPEYWIVDPEARTLERLVLRDGRYLIAESLEGSAVFRPPSFAGLELPLDELWEAARDGEAAEAEHERAFRARQKKKAATRRARRAR
jgi:Uma2 family endonuclease